MYYKNFILIIFLVLSINCINAKKIGSGIVLEENIIVYQDSSAKSAQLTKLDYLDNVLVLRDEIENAEFNQNGWCHIETNNNIQGWTKYNNLAVTGGIIAWLAPGDSLYYSSDPDSTLREVISTKTHKYIYGRRINDNGIWISPEKDFSRWIKVDSLDYQVGNRYYNLVQNFLGSIYTGFLNLSGQKNYSKAKQIAKNIESQISLRDTIYTNYSTVDYGRKMYNKTLKNRTLFKVYYTLEEYDNAIAILQKVIEKYPNTYLMNGKAGASAALRIGKIYHENLGKPDSTLKYYHFVIQNYPEEGMSGYEWKSWADIMSAYRILEISLNNNDRLINESRKIIQESNNPSVKLIGYRGIMRYLGREKYYVKMIDTVKSILNQFPNNWRESFYNKIHYSGNVFYDVYSILQNNDKNHKAKVFCEYIMENHPNITLGSLSALNYAINADKRNINYNTVKKYYKNAYSNYSKFQIYDPLFHGNVSSGIAHKRYLELKESIIRTGTITSETPIYKNITDTTEKSEYLENGTKVEIQYSSKYLYKINDSIPKNYSKIKTQTGKIGWVSSKNIQANINSIFNSQKNREPDWKSNLANFQNNPIFKKSIKEPIDKSVVKDYTSRYLRTCYINSDQTPDMLIPNTHSNNLVALDGKNREQIWSKDLNFRNLIVGNKYFFTIEGSRSLRRRETENKLIAYTIKSGERKWSLPVNSKLRAKPVYHNGKLYHLLSDSTIMAYSTNNQDTIWLKKIEPIQTKFVNGNFLINDQVLFLLTGHSIIACQPQSGKIIWSKKFDSYRKPVVDNKHLYCNDDTSLVAIDIQSGEIQWRYEFYNYSLIAFDKSIILYNEQNNIVSLQKESGQKEWTLKKDNLVGPLIGTGNKFLIGQESDSSTYILSVNKHNGNIDWKISASYKNPVFQFGKLFVSGATGVKVLGEKIRHNSYNKLGNKSVLMHNYPNPFNNATTISYELKEHMKVNLSIFNILGQKINVLVNDFQLQGLYNIEWNGRSANGQKVSSGIYFYKLQTNQSIKTGKMIYQK